MTTYDPIERVRRARRQAATLAALLAFVGLLFVIGIVKVWTGRSGPPASNAAPSTVARRDGGPDLRWEPFRAGLDLPESLSAGPARKVDGRAEGFARSQLGAALAAVHLGHRIDPAAGPGVFEPTIREQVVGPDAGKLLEKTSASYEALRQQEGNKQSGEQAHLVAYKVESQSPDAATVAVISGYDDRPDLYSVRFDLRWIDNDWHLVAPNGGDISTLLTRIQALPVGAVALSRGT